MGRVVELILFERVPFILDLWQGFGFDLCRALFGGFYSGDLGLWEMRQNGLNQRVF